MKNKKGFVTVYICLFFASLLALMFIFIGSVKQSTMQSGAESLSRLWAQAILAEYDLNLQQKYNLFGFYGYPEDVKRKLAFYADETFEGQDEAVCDISSCSLYVYSLRHIDIFKEQIVAAGKLSITEQFSAPKKEIVPVADHKVENETALFDHLPSNGTNSYFFLDSMESLLKEKWSVKDLFTKGCDRFFETKYAFAHFNHYLQPQKTGESYLKQEVEYIICGKKSDEANQRAIKRRIIAIREILNYIYLNENDLKRNEALAVAEVMTPGAAAVATQQAILALWAYAESVNDYCLLEKGYCVPMQKSASSWAVDLTSALKNETEGYIYTGTDQGDTYEDYLNLMLYMMDENVLILRMMDLVQINMRNFYYDQFLLSEYNGGVNFSVTVNGKDFEVKMCYEKES